MNTNDENRLCARLRRRLFSARGSVYIEFAFVMTLVLPLVLFAVDFMRILYCEQQLEIGARALCDIDCHMQGGKEQDWTARPSGTAKMPVREYLASVLANNGFEGDAMAANRVYCKGCDYSAPGPVQAVVNVFRDFLEGQIKTGLPAVDLFLKIIGKIIGWGLQILSFGTDSYLFDIFERDRFVKSSVSVLISPAFPTGAYVFFGHDHRDGWICIPQAANRLGDDVYDRKMMTDRRDRYYCQMPYMDTCALAPFTYIRKLLTTFKKWL